MVQDLVALEEIKATGNEEIKATGTEENLSFISDDVRFCLNPCLYYICCLPSNALLLLPEYSDRDYLRTRSGDVRGLPPARRPVDGGGSWAPSEIKPLKVEMAV
jgi:hypothetical protein